MPTLLGYDQVIKNRKWCIGAWCNSILASGSIEQVVIIAAGFAPLGVELASTFPACTIFDVDLLNMPEKQKICESISGLGANLHFVEADITDTDKCVGLLNLAGWQGNRPTLVICDGISYYIFSKIYYCFAHESKSSYRPSGAIFTHIA